MKSSLEDGASGQIIHIGLNHWKFRSALYPRAIDFEQDTVFNQTYIISMFNLYQLILKYNWSFPFLLYFDLDEHRRHWSWIKIIHIWGCLFIYKKKPSRILTSAYWKNEYRICHKKMTGQKIRLAIPIHKILRDNLKQSRIIGGV